MLLSFSVPEMLPMIRAGLRQRAGEDVGATRVKRQTIRARGPRAEKLIAWARGASWTIPYDLHLWWKSRTSEKEFIGKVECGTLPPIAVYPISILHSYVEPPNAPRYPALRIDGPRGWRRGDAVLFWSEGDPGGSFISEVLNDGFDTPQAFRDFFVPNIGDRFDAILFKW
jgi:hypothetical protein